MPYQYSPAKQRKDDAIREGKKFYEGDVSCKHCGSYEKYVSSGSCRPCAKATLANLAEFALDSKKFKDEIEKRFLL